MMPRGCYTVRDEVSGARVLIPYCWSVINSDADEKNWKHLCTCPENNTLSDKQVDRAWTIAEEAASKVPAGPKYDEYMRMVWYFFDCIREDKLKEMDKHDAE